MRLVNRAERGLSVAVCFVASVVLRGHQRCGFLSPCLLEAVATTCSDLDRSIRVAKTYADRVRSSVYASGEWLVVDTFDSMVDEFEEYAQHIASGSLGPAGQPWNRMSTTIRQRASEFGRKLKEITEATNLFSIDDL